MISQLEKEITFRYLKTRKKDGFLNIISIFSFIGISLGVAVLIIVMSVMNGFRSELINKNLKIISKELVFSNSGEAIVINKDYTKGLLLRGYKREDFSKLEIVKQNSFIGNPDDLYENNISIGKELSFDLNLKLGDKIMIMSPSGIQTIVGDLPKQQSFIIHSIYDSGLAEFNKNVAFININTLDVFFDLSKKDRNLEIYLKDPVNIEKLKEKIQLIFNEEFVYSWSDINSSLFSALKVERNVMFIILSLIIIVAAFNIISGLTILVKNKTREIAILKSIGVLNKSITKIFFLVGVIIGTSATFFGIFLGVMFSLYIEKIRSFLSDIFNISLFPEEIYFLNKMPSEIEPNSIFIISFCSIIITILVSIFPAIKASRLDPVKALKYE